jgi:transketolase
MEAVLTMDKQKLKQLKKYATLIRRHIIEEVYHAASGHPGGSLSCTDIFAVLYFHEMRVDIHNPQWSDRDRFVLSKGHCAPASFIFLIASGIKSSFPLV